MNMFAREDFLNVEVGPDGFGDVIVAENTVPHYRHFFNAMAADIPELGGGQHESTYFDTIADARRYYYMLEYAVRSYTQITLMPAQREVLSFVLRRTIYWGRMAEAILINHFTDGVYTKKEGHCVTQGLNLTKRKILTSLDELNKMDLVYTIVVESIHTWPEMYAVDLKNLHALLSEQLKSRIEQ